METRNSHEKAGDSPLLVGVARVRDRVESLKHGVKAWYFRVLLSAVTCPACGQGLRMIGVSQAQCKRGHTVDPTVAFQESDCCGAPLKRRNCHYACSRCGHTVASRFLFDERIFDPAYFAASARESRERKRQKIEAMRQLLAGTRSSDLNFGDVPDLDAVPGLAMDLDQFVGGVEAVDVGQFLSDDVFDMRAYWDSIVTVLHDGEILFSRIPPMHGNARVDRVRCFRTLVQMWHEREVNLTQYGNDLLVEAL